MAWTNTCCGRVQQLPGVALAAPILDQNASLVGNNGRRVAVDLASAAPSLLALGGGITHSISLHDLHVPGVILPSETAEALGLSRDASQASGGPSGRVTVELRGRASSAAVVAVLGPEALGGLSGAMAAIAPLAFVQKIAGLAGRVTRIVVTTAPGRQAEVRKELTVLAAGRLTVAPADQEVGLIEQAVAPNTEATGFFALVSGIVGLLLAFNAMLLTVPERRRMIADLRMQGVKPWQLVKLLLFQAVCLGMVASLVGLAIGDFLSARSSMRPPATWPWPFPWAQRR